MISRTRAWNRASAAIIATAALAVLGSIAALLLSWQLAGFFHSAVNENIPALHAAEELEIALLEQRGFVSAYMMDGGNQEWLEELKRRKSAFEVWLAKARNTARTPAQEEILNQLKQVYQAYNQKRDEVVALYGEGNVEKAHRVFLSDVNKLYHQAYLLCEDFVRANQDSIDVATTRAHDRIRWIARMVFLCVGLIVGLGGASLWILARGLRAEHSKIRYEAHLLAARQIQEYLLPDLSPELPGFDIRSIWHPAEFVAGDYFDYLHFMDGSLGVVVGDVTGHGVGPALLMASTRAYLRSLVKTHNDLSKIMGLVNEILAHDVGEGRFVTLLLVRLDPPSGTLTYVNAGHPPGYVVDASGKVKAKLEGDAFPLGIVPDAGFSLGSPVSLAPGDIVILFSDGLLEATSPDGRCFGIDRVLETVRVYRKRSAEEIADHLDWVMREHVCHGELRDDVTAVVIKVQHSPRNGRAG